MNQKDIVDIFKQLGWKTKRGGTSCRMDLSDRFVQIQPRLKILPDQQKLDLALSVPTEKFSSYVDIISGANNKTTPLIVDFKINQVIYSQEFSGEDILNISKSIINWAEEQDLNSGLEKYAKLPPTSAGALPLRHIAALAILDKRDELKDYKKSFAAGGNAGFAPYITEDYIDHAIALLQS